MNILQTCIIAIHNYKMQQRTTAAISWLKKLGVYTNQLSLYNTNIDITDHANALCSLFNSNKFDVNWRCLKFGYDKILNRKWCNSTSRYTFSFVKTKLSLRWLYNLLIHQDDRNWKTAFACVSQIFSHITVQSEVSYTNIVNKILYASDIVAFKILDASKVKQSVNNDEFDAISQRVVDKCIYGHSVYNFNFSADLKAYIWGSSWKTILLPADQLVIAIIMLKDRKVDSHYYDEINSILWPQGGVTVESTTSFPDFIKTNGKHRRHKIMFSYRQSFEHYDLKSVLFVKMHNTTNSKYYLRKYCYSLNQYKSELDMIKAYINLGLNMDFDKIFTQSYSNNSELAEYLWDQDLVKLSENIGKKCVLYYILEMKNDKLLKKMLLQNAINFNISCQCYKKRYNNAIEFLNDRITNGPKTKQGHCRMNKFIIADHILYQKIGSSIDDMLNDLVKN